MAAAATALEAPQLHFEIGQSHVIGPAIGQASMVERRPMPTSRTDSFDHMPTPQILEPERVARRQLRHRRSCVRYSFS
jgi:hypothetical protein